MNNLYFLISRQDCSVLGNDKRYIHKQFFNCSTSPLYIVIVFGLWEHANMLTSDTTNRFCSLSYILSYLKVMSATCFSSFTSPLMFSYCFLFLSPSIDSEHIIYIAKPDTVVWQNRRVWLNETTILLYKWRISPLIFMSCNLAHDEVHSIQAKVVTFDLRQVGDFSTGTPVSSTNKIDRNDMLQILLKVRLNTS